jgi:hypothetical protein
MFTLRPILLRTARLTPVTFRPTFTIKLTNFTRTMATESPTKKLKTDGAPVIGTHK